MIDLRCQLAKMLEVNFNNISFNACSDHDTPTSLDLADWTTINVVEIRASVRPPNLKVFTNPSRLVRSASAPTPTTSSWATMVKPPLSENYYAREQSKECQRQSTLNPLITKMIEKVLDNEDEDNETFCGSTCAGKENTENQKDTESNKLCPKEPSPLVDAVHSRTTSTSMTTTTTGLSVMFESVQHDSTGELRLAAENLVDEMVQSALCDISVNC